MENSYGVRDVVDLLIFNEEGELITKLDTLKESKIISDDENSYIFVKDALLNINLLRFQQNSTNKSDSDFKSALNHIKGVPIVINKYKKNIKCKLIAKLILKNRSTLKDEDVYYEIPTAEISNKYEIKTDIIGDPSTFDILFKIMPNENGDLFTIHGMK